MQLQGLISDTSKKTPHCILSIGKSYQTNSTQHCQTLILITEYLKKLNSKDYLHNALWQHKECDISTTDKPSAG